MTSITATEARKSLYRLVDEVSGVARAGPDHRQARQRRARGRGRLARGPGDTVPRLDSRHARVDPRGHGHAGRLSSKTSSTGELAPRLHEGGPEGCQEPGAPPA